MVKTAWNAGFSALMAVALLVATGCSQPADRPLVTDSTQEAYQTSLQPLAAEMSVEQRRAFDWAVSDFDLAKLHANYPNASPLKIIRGEVRHVLDTYPDRIKALQARQAKDAPLRAALGRIVASNTRFSLERDFFGLQPTIRATVTNGSDLAVSRLDWQASLYLNDAKEPVATTVLGNDYRNHGGLRPKSVFTSTFKVGFVGGDERWSTLEIRNARKARVVLVPIINSVRDFGDRQYLGEDAASQIQTLQAAFTTAKTYAEL